jgi:hypothetical protein
MPFIGNQPAEKYSSFQKQDFTTSATTSYTLDHPVANGNEIALFINFVRQEPTAAYTASGTSLTLTSATTSSDDMYCVYLGKAVQTVNPPNSSVGSSQVSADLITGQTALGATPADTDELLISDAGTLKRVDFSYLKVANTPTFHAYRSSTLSVANTTQTLVTFDTEAFDSASAYDTSTGKFTPQVAGKYVVYTQITPNSASDFDVFEAQLYKNAVTTAGTQAICRGRNEEHETKYINRIVEFNGSTDFVYVYVYQSSGSSKDVRGTKYDTFFGAYKIIE